MYVNYVIRFFVLATHPWAENKNTSSIQNYAHHMTWIPGGACWSLVIVVTTC